mmetsp:Transcript_62679/g.198482  ORF Transcript_62679/g.198482 Transcript_62679/m.198482 type:complete len:271 (-) Transcript_62679:2001-2813(-)
MAAPQRSPGVHRVVCRRPCHHRVVLRARQRHIQGQGGGQGADWTPRLPGAHLRPLLLSSHRVPCLPGRGDRDRGVHHFVRRGEAGGGEEGVHGGRIPGDGGAGDGQLSGLVLRLIRHAGLPQPHRRQRPGRQHSGRRDHQRRGGARRAPLPAAACRVPAKERPRSHNHHGMPRAGGPGCARDSTQERSVPGGPGARLHPLPHPRLRRPERHGRLDRPLDRAGDWAGVCAPLRRDGATPREHQLQEHRGERQHAHLLAPCHLRVRKRDLLR